jgi:hypothetical protein
MRNGISLIIEVVGTPHLRILTGVVIFNFNIGGVIYETKSINIHLNKNNSNKNNSNKNNSNKNEV